MEVIQLLYSMDSILELLEGQCLPLEDLEITNGDSIGVHEFFCFEQGIFHAFDHISLINEELLVKG